jgi:hypothetical protein
VYTITPCPNGEDAGEIAIIDNDNGDIAAYGSAGSLLQYIDYGNSNIVKCGTLNSTVSSLSCAGGIVVDDSVDTYVDCIDCQSYLATTTTTTTTEAP